MARPSSGGSTGNDPPEFCCPITDEIMEDPVVLIQSGQTFDRKSIEGWFRQGKTTCPLTGVELTSIQLTTNFALKTAIQNWKQKQAAARSSGRQNGNPYYPVVQMPSMYPDLAQDDRPQDKIEQVSSAVKKLQSPSLDAKAYRDQRIYELWTLSELMSDPYCCDEFVNRNALVVVVRFLTEDNSSGCKAAAARLLQKLALTPASPIVYSILHPDGIRNLVRILGVPDPAMVNRPSCREAAALALVAMSAVNKVAQDEIFFQLCARSKELASGTAGPLSFVLPLGLLFQVSASSESQAAADLIAQITQKIALQEYSPYSSCQGTQALQNLVTMLVLQSPSPKQALLGLLYTPNQGAIIQELLNSLGNQTDREFREASGRLLWEAAAVNINLVAVISQMPAFASALETALRGRSINGAGLVQLMTCDHPRTTNSVVSAPNTDAIRLQLVSYDQVIPSLVQLLYSDDQLCAQAAVHALANLAAFRSGTTESRFKPLGLGSHSSNSYFHPSHIIASGDALPRLMGLLSCPDPAVLAPAVALLNNLCAENENRDKVKDAARLWGFDQLRQRLEGLMGWAVLSDKIRTAARIALQRLQAGKLERTPEKFVYVTLLMKPPT